jgi:hypothetical protein
VDAGPAPRMTGPPSKVHFDGVYVAESLDPSGTAIGWDYVRFFENGAVVTLSTPAPAEAIIGWLLPEDDRPAKGQYVIKGETIAFSAQSQFGIVDYEGTIEGPALRLAWRSRINGAESGGQYVFVQVAMEAPPPTEQEEAAAAAGATKWSCTHPTAKSPASSYCSREQATCQQRRRVINNKYPKAKMSACEPQPVAFCRTGRVGKKQVESCFASEDDCARGKSSKDSDCTEL